MSELLFTLLITPLETIYRLVFQGLFNLVHNYGLALLCLSLLTALVTAPMEKVVAHHVNKEKKLDEILRPQIARIKAETKGAEQSQRLRNLYNRYSYNPIYSIRSAFGVLMQLPFLMGAYWALSNFTALKGVSFGPITDLSQPDALLWGINLLPILMTLANLASVALMMDLNKRNRIQACVIAVVFLVLLYAAPSALLVYWTGNNVILLVKTLVRRLTQFKPKKVLAYRLNLQWTVEQKWAFSVYAFSVVLVLLTLKQLHLSANAVHYLKMVSDFLLLGVLTFVTVPQIKKGWQKGAKTELFKSTLFALVTLFATIRVFGVWTAGFDRRLLSTQLLCFIPIVIGLIHWRAIQSRLRKPDIDLSEVQKLYWPSCFVVLGLVCFYFPVVLYISDTKAFQETGSEILLNQVVIFEIALTLAFVLWTVLKQVGKATIALVMAFLALTSLAFGFLMVPDYGVMDAFVLQKTQALYDKSHRIYDICIGAFTIFILLFVVLKRKEHILRRAFGISALVSIALPLIQFCFYLDSKEEFKNEINVNVPEDVRRFFQFSKNGKNVVVVMLDMFTGGHIKEVLERSPEIADQLDGFIWYPDTVSAGGVTIFGKPGLLGGKQLHPLEINKTRGISLEEKINRGWADFIVDLQKNNYETAIYDYLWLKPDLMKPLLEHPAILRNTWPLWDGFTSHWLKKNGMSKDAVNSKVFLSLFGLFKVLPNSLKKHIYKNGRWIENAGVDVSNQNFSLEWFAALASMRDFSTLGSTKNTFKFITNLTSHHPWNLDESCRPTTKKISYELGPNILNEAHFQAELCSLKALVTWFEWMKSVGIYDNTQIILVSDHGFGDSSQLRKTWNGRYPNRIHALLMVKNLGNKGPLKVSDELMANWDIPELIATDQGFSEQPFRTSANRERCVTVSWDWDRKKMPKDHFKYSELYCVKGTIFKRENWQELTQEELKLRNPKISVH